MNEGVAARGADRWAPLVVLLVVLAVFWPVCGHEFLSWDDYPNVARNPHFNPPTLSGVLYFWSHPYIFLYIPLTYTVWGGLAAAGWVGTPDPSGIFLNPALFHAANLLVHVAAAFFAYRLLLLLTKRPWPACAGALLFAIHPLQVEPVAWVTGLKDVLAGALSLAALWQYLAAVIPAPPENDGSRRRESWLHYLIATLSFALAMLAKPSAVTVPLMALLLDRWVIRRPWRAIAGAVAPWFLLAIPIVLVAKFVQPAAAAAGAGPAWARPLLAGDALAFYLYKLVFPARLAVQYHHAPLIAIAHRWIYFTWIIPVAVALIAWLYRRRFPWLLAAAGLFVAATLPVQGWVPFYFEKISLVADRYLYVAMIGPALAVACVLSMARRSRALTRGLTAACIAVLAALGSWSWVQTRNWRDTVTLFEHNLAVNPWSDVACNVLAIQSIAARQPERAVDFAQRAVRLAPDDVQGYLSLGQGMMMLGRPEEAITAYRRAVEVAPDNSLALNGLAGLIAGQGRLDEAIQICRRAIQADSNNASAHLNLGLMFLQKGQVADALRETELGVDLNPQNPQAQARLGMLLARTGQRQAAIEHFSKALELDPNNQQVRRDLARLTGSPAQ